MQEYRLTKIKLEHSGRTISIARGSLTVYNDEASVWYAEIEQPSEVDSLYEWKEKDKEEEGNLGVPHLCVFYYKHFR